jgi:hypothetical protein
MKKNFLAMAFVSLFTVAVFNSCNKDKDGKEDENGGIYKITAAVENGSSYNEKIDNVKALIGASVVANSAYSDGGFVLELPASVNEQYLESIEALFDGNIPAGITVSNPDVKNGRVDILAYKSNQEIGAFYYGASGWTGFLLYADGDASITGSYIDSEDGATQEMDLHLTKGWNIIYTKFTFTEEGMSYIETTGGPSGARWYFDSEQ